TATTRRVATARRCARSSKPGAPRSSTDGGREAPLPSDERLHARDVPRTPTFRRLRTRVVHRTASVAHRVRARSRVGQSYEPASITRTAGGAFMGDKSPKAKAKNNKQNSSAKTPKPAAVASAAAPSPAVAPGKKK